MSAEPDANDPFDTTAPPPKRAPRYQLTLTAALGEVPAAEWDALLDSDDAPLLAHGYLEALEHSGCVGGASGFTPAHLLLRDERGALCAAAPAYLKTHSEGEWVYDLPWAQWAEQLGGAYYPKLVLAVPYNPVSGRRVLTPPGLPAEERAARVGALLRGARRLCGQLQVSSLHALFPRAEELPLLAAAGLLPRRQEQYHFHNRGYRSFDDFLAALRHNRRRTIKKERAALREAGITVRTHRGLQGHVPGGASTVAADLRDLEAGPFSLEELWQVQALYEGTSRRYTGDPPYLSRAHFQRCAEQLGDRVELVLARDRAGALLAGAFNLRGDTRLYGRHWGEATHIPGLHFEVCLYHGIERCIRLGMASFEPGHGGEQKLLRGFAPVYTYSAHGMLDLRLQRAVSKYLALEAPLIEEALREAQARCPLKELPDPAEPASLQRAEEEAHRPHASPESDSV